jgi:uncharacterized membrane-anchored protein
MPLGIESHLRRMRDRREGFWRDAPVPAPEQAAINRLPPNSAEAMLALAEAVAEAGQPGNARLLAEQALALAPGHPGARPFLAAGG